jgi:hypothetical protein
VVLSLRQIGWVADVPAVPWELSRPRPGWCFRYAATPSVSVFSDMGNLRRAILDNSRTWRYVATKTCTPSQNPGTRGELRNDTRCGDSAGCLPPDTPVQSGRLYISPFVHY